mgnify:CR=1 FL=1
MKQGTMEMYVRINTVILTVILGSLVSVGVMSAKFYKKNKNNIDKMLNAGNDIEDQMRSILNVE